jgi:TRAP-type C4-dicarboxylate transport system, small permease component
MSFLQTLGKAQQLAKKVLEYFVFLLFATMTVLTFAQVFTRFMLNISLSWSEEVSRFVLVWLIFAASILTYGEKIHIVVDLLTTKLTGTTSIVVQLINRLCVLLFCVFICLGALEFMPFTAMQKSPANGIVMAYIYLAIPFSMVFMGLITVKEICELVTSFRQSKEGAA